MLIPQFATNHHARTRVGLHVRCNLQQGFPCEDRDLPVAVVAVGSGSCRITEHIGCVGSNRTRTAEERSWLIGIHIRKAAKVLP